MWGTDATAAFTEEDGQVTVFMAVDHCTAVFVGIHAAKPGTRFEALEPIRQAVRSRFIVAHLGVDDPAHFEGSPQAKERFSTTPPSLYQRLQLFTSLPPEKLDRLRVERLTKEIGSAGAGEIKEPANG